jgi:hypothetical protein
MDAETLEFVYWRAYKYFYRWRSIWTGASTRETLPERIRHMAYSAGWKKFEPVWDLAIRSRQVVHALPLLEAVLTGFGRHRESGFTGYSWSGIWNVTSDRAGSAELNAPPDTVIVAWAATWHEASVRNGRGPGTGTGRWWARTGFQHWSPASAAVAVAKESRERDWYHRSMNPGE